jgi:hypothetical protein
MRFALLMLLVGCTADPDVVVENVGELHVHAFPDSVDPSQLDEIAPDKSTLPLVAGRVVFTVRHNMNGCDAFEASCVVRQVGAGFVIESQLSWNTTTETCSRVVHTAFAHCLSPVLAEGAYSVAFGHARAELAIPSEPGMLIDTSVALQD